MAHVRLKVEDETLVWLFERLGPQWPGAGGWIHGANARPASLWRVTSTRCWVVVIGQWPWILLLIARAFMWNRLLTNWKKESRQPQLESDYTRRRAWKGEKKKESWKDSEEENTAAWSDGKRETGWRLHIYTLPSKHNQKQLSSRVLKWLKGCVCVFVHMCVVLPSKSSLSLTDLADVQPNI